MNLISKNKKGFTILEAIVAIAILSLAISGSFSAIRSGLFASSNAKEEIQAFYLVQEVVEIVRNRRDANRLDTLYGGVSNWLTGITLDSPIPARGQCHVGETCTFDSFNNNISACSGSWGSCPVLRQDPNTFIYGYNGAWPATKFRREMQIESISATEVSLTVRISWTHGALNREFKTKTILTDWL